MKHNKAKALAAAMLCILMLLPLVPKAAAAVLFGDVNFDGEVTAADARLTLRKAVGLEEFTNEQWYAADLDDDYAITSADARLILRMSVGLPVDLPDIPDPIVEPDPPQPTKEELRATWLASFPDSVSYDDLESNMYWLVNDIGERSWWNSSQNNTANLLYGRLQSYGYYGSDLQVYDFYRNGVRGRNVMAVIPTAVYDPEIIVVSAHYDTARSIGGAVDNSSGAVALLQLAKRFKAADEDFGVEVRFLFTAGEEQGYYGAYAYVDSLSYHEQSRHAFTIIMDMAGRPNHNYYQNTEFMLAISTESAYAYNAYENKGSRAADETRDALGDMYEYGYYSPVYAGLTDIIPFRNAGMEAIGVSWRCINYSNSHGSEYGLASPTFIHTSSDSIYNFDMTSLYKTTRLVAGTLARLILPYTDLAY